MRTRVSRGLLIAVGVAALVALASLPERQDILGALLVAALVVTVLVLWALPTLVAWRMGHPRLLMIAATNLVGFFVFGIGWFAAWLFFLPTTSELARRAEAATAGDERCPACAVPFRSGDYRESAPVWRCAGCGINLLEARSA